MYYHQTITIPIHKLNTYGANIWLTSKQHVFTQHTSRQPRFLLPVMKGLIPERNPIYCTGSDQAMLQALPVSPQTTPPPDIFFTTQWLSWRCKIVFPQVHSYSINDYITADRNSLYSSTVVRDLMNAKHFRKHPTLVIFCKSQPVCNIEYSGFCSTSGTYNVAMV